MTKYLCFMVADGSYAKLLYFLIISSKNKDKVQIALLLLVQYLCNRHT